MTYAHLPVVDVKVDLDAIEDRIVQGVLDTSGIVALMQDEFHYNLFLLIWLNTNKGIEIEYKKRLGTNWNIETMVFI